MKDDKKIPFGLAALTIPLIISGVYSVFNFMVLAIQSNEGFINLLINPSKSTLFLIISSIFYFFMVVGVILLYRAAFIIYVIFYGYQLFICIFITANAGQYGRFIFSTSAMVYSVVLFMAYYYRSYFFQKNPLL